MRNDTGIFNSRHSLNEYKHDLQRAAEKVSFKAPAMFTIVSYAEKIDGRYEAILWLIKGAEKFDPALAAKGDRIACEYEAQLTMLAKYADDLAEAGLTS